MTIRAWVVLLVASAGLWPLALARAASVEETPAQAELAQGESQGNAFPALSPDVLAALMNGKRAKTARSGRRVLSAEELEGMPRYLANRRGAWMASSGDLIVARGNWDEGQQSYEVLRPGMTLIAPDSKESLGVEAQTIATALLLQREGELGTLRVTEARREIRAGDLLLPLVPLIPFVPLNPAGKPAGLAAGAPAPGLPAETVLLQIGDGRIYGAQYDSLILAAGEREGLSPGQLLSLQRPAQSLSDPRTGERLHFSGETFGVVLVYRVFERSSLGLVLESTGPVRIDDKLVTP